MNDSKLPFTTIFWRFLSLGLISFGGPVAHIGYFQNAFVERWRWLDQDSFMRLTAGCQLLPGPASSQLGFAIGLRAGGLAGGIAAFLGFTLPSFLLMSALAIYAPSDSTWGQVVISALKLAAVIVVADACLTMFKNFCTTPFTKGIAAVTALTLLIIPNPIVQLGVIVAAALAGPLPSRSTLLSSVDWQQRFHGRSGIALAAFCLLFLAAPVMVLSTHLWAQVWSGFYQSGSLVFGGGHVVLPLLQQQVGELVGDESFLLGYAGAQAIPGPLFTFASFLGAEIFTSTPWLGAAVATIALFLPGFLLVLAFERFWVTQPQDERLSLAFGRINAAVVGLLLAAFVQPVLTSAVAGAADTIIVLAGLAALRTKKVGVLWLIAILIGLAVLRHWVTL